MIAWDVYVPKVLSKGFKRIDTVFYDDNCDAEYVYDDLINHDGYPYNIHIVNTRTRKKYPKDK